MRRRSQEATVTRLILLLAAVAINRRAVTEIRWSQQITGAPHYNASVKEKVRAGMGGRQFFLWLHC